MVATTHFVDNEYDDDIDKYEDNKKQGLYAYTHHHYNK